MPAVFRGIRWFNRERKEIRAKRSGGRKGNREKDAVRGRAIQQRRQEKLLGEASVESQYVVPPFSLNVSESRTGQGACVCTLAPRFKGKRERQLRRKEGEEMAQFTHHVRFRQPLGSTGEDALTASPLGKKAAVRNIDVSVEHLVAPRGTQSVLRATQIESSVGSQAPEPTTGG